MAAIRFVEKEKVPSNQLTAIAKVYTNRQHDLFNVLTLTKALSRTKTADHFIYLSLLPTVFCHMYNFIIIFNKLMITDKCLF